MKKVLIKLIYEYKKIIQSYIDIVKDLENFDSKNLQHEFKHIYNNKLFNLTIKLKIAIKEIEKIESEKIKQIKQKFLIFLKSQFKLDKLSQRLKLSKNQEKQYPTKEIEMWIEENKENKFIMKIQKEFMYGSVEPWCNNQGVAILPYVLKENEYHYLLTKEYNPLFKNKQISEYSTITGGLENNNFIKTVLNEMLEETGINNITKFEFLGKHFANKSSTKLWWLFIIDLTNLNLDLTKTYKGDSDGSVGEQNTTAKFVSHKELNELNDLLALAIYGKWHLLKENEKLKSKEISITSLEENKKIQKQIEDHTNSFWKEIKNKEIEKIESEKIINIPKRKRTSDNLDTNFDNSQIIKKQKNQILSDIQITPSTSNKNETNSEEVSHCYDCIKVKCKKDWNELVDENEKLKTINSKLVDENEKLKTINSKLVDDFNNFEKKLSALEKYKRIYDDLDIEIINEQIKSPTFINNDKKTDEIMHHKTIINKRLKRQNEKESSDISDFDFINDILSDNSEMCNDNLYQTEKFQYHQ